MASDYRAAPPSIERCLSSSGNGYSPAHITGFFTIHMAGDPICTGSTGAGICLKDGVTSEVAADDSGSPRFTLTVNGAPVNSPTCVTTVKSMLAGLPPLSIRVKQSSLMPANYGYGISAASALSVAIAISSALGLDLPKTEIGKFAHTAEVENFTGLGDVSAELAGGFEVRLKPGAPGFGEVQSLPFLPNRLVVTAPVLQFATKRMITEPVYVERINKLGGAAMDAFLESPTLDSFMRQSRIFWEGVGIADEKIRSVMSLFEKAGIAFPSAKKGLVFGIVSRDELPGVLKRLVPCHREPEGDPPFLMRDDAHGMKLIISEISERGAC